MNSDEKWNLLRKNLESRVEWCDKVMPHFYPNTNVFRYVMNKRKINLSILAMMEEFDRS